MLERFVQHFLYRRGCFGFRLRLRFDRCGRRFDNGFRCCHRCSRRSDFGRSFPGGGLDNAEGRQQRLHGVLEQARVHLLQRVDLACIKIHVIAQRFQFGGGERGFQPGLQQTHLDLQRGAAAEVLNIGIE